MSETNETTEVVKKKKKWLVPVIIGAAAILFVIIAVVILVVVLAVTAPKRALKKQLDLGQKYLTELDYDQAILAYEDALKIDPKNEEAYLGLIGIYETLAEECKDEVPQKAMEYYVVAKEYASTGVQETNSEVLKQKATELDVEIEGCKALLNESAIEQVKMVRQHDIFDILFNQRRSFDADYVWVPVKVCTYEPTGELLDINTSEYEKTETGYRETYKGYTPEGRLYQEDVYEFDNRGLLISATTHGYWETGEVANGTIQCLYDEDGILKSIISTSDWGGNSEDITEYMWNVSEPGSEYTYKVKRTYRGDWGERVDDYDWPSIPPYLWIGDITRGGIFVDTFPEEYTYEVLEDKKIKEDTGYLQVVFEFEQLKDACKSGV